MYVLKSGNKAGLRNRASSFIFNLGGSFIRVALVDDRGNIERMRRTEMVDCPDERIAIIVRMANVSGSFHNSIRELE